MQLKSDLSGLNYCDFPVIFLQTIAKPKIPAAHKQLLMNMGRPIQFPGNHCLEYQDKEIIGKCSMRVTVTSAFSPMVDVVCAAFKLPATDMVIGRITTLSPK
ncbi:MAG: hypothetical protein PVG73_09505 [Desulfobacterales bacterium]